MSDSFRVGDTGLEPSVANLLGRIWGDFSPLLQGVLTPQDPDQNSLTATEIDSTLGRIRDTIAHGSTLQPRIPATTRAQAGGAITSPPLLRVPVSTPGWRTCTDCGRKLPDFVSRCRRRTCPGYAQTWARDTLRKLRENLRAYGGKAAMLTLTAPGRRRSRCRGSRPLLAFGGCRLQRAPWLSGRSRRGRSVERRIPQVLARAEPRLQATRRPGTAQDGRRVVQGPRPRLPVGATSSRPLAPPLRCRR